MNARPGRSAPVLVVGGGIGGMAVALALSQSGFAVELFEQSSEIGEIGAGLQLGPNGFAAMDALGVGERARKRAVYTDELVMMDAIDGNDVARIPVGEAFRRRFNNPYAVIHRADIHQSVYEEVQLAPDIAVHTSARIVRVDLEAQAVRLVDADGDTHLGRSVIGCDGVHSVVRKRLIGDGHRVSGHVVYRAVVPRADMPADLRWNAAAIWVGPNCHLVHYPLRGGEQYNIVVTFHSRSRNNGACARARATRSCRTSPRSATGRASCSTSRPRGSDGRPPIAIRSIAGAKAGRRCLATPPIRCCSTWRKAPASRSRMR